VGSGPSGCYTAKYLQLALAPTTTTTTKIKIDILDRLPTAYGLVRNGVAPDHPEVKNVQNDFDQLITSSDGNIQFYGNVNVGQDVSLQELRQLYDIVVLAYGCESDRPLRMPGNNFQGILSAREFVAWYNGHVDFEWVGPIVERTLQQQQQQPQQQSPKKSNNIVVIGHGNVALDCARILAKTREELDPTDIATRALEVLSDSESTPRQISIVGRRGHVQGAFTIKEVRELTKLTHAELVVRSDELAMGKATEASQQELKNSRPRTRVDKLLTDYCSSSAAAAAASSSDDSSKNYNDDTTKVLFRFLMNPIRFESDDGSSLARVVCERTQLVGEAGQQKAEGTGEEETLEAELVRARKSANHIT
jgi:adrenodoxin-NADP+ reductase